MKVAILTRDYPPAIGGIATHVDGLVRALRRTGIEADLYVGRNDVKTLLLPFDIPLKEYDLVHVQSLPYGAFVFGVPLVVTVHSPVLEEFATYRRAVKLFSIPALGFERATLSRASAVLAVSDRSRRDLLSSYGVNSDIVQVIGNGVDYERFSVKRDPAEMDRPKRILVVSRLEPRKNVREAIEAVAELPKGESYLEIAGEGSERSALADLAEHLDLHDAVRFLGRVDTQALPELYGRAAIFLTTSRSEGFGLSLLEAMAAGCACLASNLPTHRALVEDGITGRIYNSKSDLVSCLKEMLSSPEYLQKLGRQAREAARAYTWEGVAAKVADSYEKVVLANA